MSATPDFSEHPLLEWAYISFYRLECDDNMNHEVCTPELVRLVWGKLETIFSVGESAQEVHIEKVQEKFRACLQKLWISSIVSPFFTERFFWFSRFIDMDEKKPWADEREEVKNWIEYGGIQNEMYCDDWLCILSEVWVKVRRYDTESKSFFSE